MQIALDHVVEAFTLQNATANPYAKKRREQKNILTYSIDLSDISNDSVC